HCSADDSSSAKLCCSGKIVRGEIAHPTVELQKLLADSTPLRQEEIERLYSLVADFKIGPMLRVIESAWVSRDSSLILKVSVKGRSQKGNVSSWSLDPLLLNACYFLNADNTKPLTRIQVPLFVESLTVCDRVPDT